MTELLKGSWALWDLKLVDPVANSHGFYTVNKGKAVKTTFTCVMRESSSLTVIGLTKSCDTKCRQKIALLQHAVALTFFRRSD